MGKAQRQLYSLAVIIISLTLLNPVSSISQRCTPNTTQTFSLSNFRQDDTSCPQHSTCNSQGYCVCERGYFGNCQTQGQFIDSQSKEFYITQNITYFLIEPTLNEFVSFQFVLCNEKSGQNYEALNLWVDDGSLITPSARNALGNDKSLNVDQGCMALVTSFFSFALQPNGQTELLILGIRLTNPGSVKVQLMVQEVEIFGFDIVFRIILILVSGIILISLGGFIYCMYKCRRRRNTVDLTEEKFDINHFEEMMPSKKANLQEIKEEMCSVCLGQFKENEEIRPTACGHYFHKACIDEWCVTNLSCPICRTSFQKSNLVHIQYLMSRRNSSSTNEGSSIGDGIINEENSIRQPIV